MYSAYLIEPDQKQPKWQRYNFVHGVYALVFGRDDMNYYAGMSDPAYIRANNGGPWNFAVKIERDPSYLFDAMRVGNIRFDGDQTTIIGRFVKKGRELYFRAEGVPYEFNSY